MNLKDLKTKSKTELIEISRKYKIDTKRKTKKEIIDEIVDTYYQKKKDKYTQLNQLGKSGKEGTVYLVKHCKKDYALKQFRNHKVPRNIQKEAEMQQKCAKHGISPKIKEVNLHCKYIVMDKMDYSLQDLIKKYNGRIPKKYQQEIINLIAMLDKIKVFHGDPNPSNFMIKDKRLYLIDYGFAKEIDDKLIEKHGTKELNKHFMIVGLLIQLKQTYGGNFVKCDLLRNEVSEENRKMLDI